MRLALRISCLFLSIVLFVSGCLVRPYCFGDRWPFQLFAGLWKINRTFLLWIFNYISIGFQDTEFLLHFVFEHHQHIYHSSAYLRHAHTSDCLTTRDTSFLLTSGHLEGLEDIGCDSTLWGKNLWPVGGPSLVPRRRLQDLPNCPQTLNRAASTSMISCRFFDVTTTYPPYDT